MWNRLQKPLLALSIGLNVAFIAIWVAHAIQDPKTEQRIPKEVSSHAVSSSLHRRIGVTPEQWKQIEPHVQYFSEKTKEQRRRIQALRCQLLDLLAKPAVEKKALQEKQKELIAINRQIKGMVIELLLKEKDILTPEQHNGLIREMRQRLNCDKENGQRGTGLVRVLSDDESIKGKEDALN